jgi:hypothetical protein
MIDINPLDILNCRKLSYIPGHFAKMHLSEVNFLGREISSWIQNRLKGRYSIANMPAVDKDGKLKTATFVAFEDQKELTYFMLACPHLRRN